MLSKALQSILRRYFGQFITGLENVELTFWSGKINIQNASFKHDKINELLKIHNIPLSIKLSFLGSLQIDIPWNRLASAPVEIKLNDVLIVLRLQKVIPNFQETEDMHQNAKLILIKNYLTYLMKKSQQAQAEQESESGFLKKLFIKILHNLNLEIGNIHIRIENHNGTIIQSGLEDQFVDCKEEGQGDLGFSLGFCIEGIQAHTISAQGQKEFVKVDNDKTEIRKRINMRQISLYWEESSAINIFELPQDRKLQFLRSSISRNKHRLLTIDGQILMERGRDSFDYFFSTSFRLLEVGLNYEQLKQFLQLYQQFANAKAKKKITKLKELEYVQQLALEREFKSSFSRLQTCNFRDVDKNDITLLQSLDKKLLMRWTKEVAIEAIKRSKLKEAFQNKNKKTWLGFLSKNTQSQLTQNEIAMIEKEIEKLMKMIDEQDVGKTIGFYVHFHLLRLVMDHHSVQQQLLFSAQNIELQFQTNKGAIKAGLQISDVALVYEDLLNHSKVSIFQNNQDEGTQKYFTLRYEDNKQIKKVDMAINSMRIIHQIQFLSFLAELIKLRERERIKGQMGLIAPKLKAQAARKQGQEKGKLYECRIVMKKLEILVQLSNSAKLNAYIDGINITKSDKESNSHNARIVNFGIAFIQTEQTVNKSYKILDDLNVEVTLQDGLNLVQSCIPLLRLTLNQESLYYIIHCMRDQYAILKIRSQERLSEASQEKFMEGEVSTISVFKAVNLYHCILTADHLYFYEKPGGKVAFDKLAKKLLLKNMNVCRQDALTFKLESVFVNEILTCKDKQQTEKWIYQIEQRIFDNSTRMQMFDMMEEEALDGSPTIYIPYDSRIQILAKKIEIIYQKNTKEKILALELRKLLVDLKENNLQFQRKIDLQEIKITNLSLEDQQREQFNLILSNTYNYFEDPNEDEEGGCNIEVLIEGKKKTHPKYTGEVTIKSKVNKLFINFDAEFVFGILYRLVVGDVKSKYYTQETKFTKIFGILQEILLENNGIDKRYENAKDFEFNRSYVELDQYKSLYSCSVLFHVEIKCEQAQVYLLNGRNFHWMDKFNGEGISFQIDKSTDFLFIKGSATSICLADITGYPNTTSLPFHQLDPYPFIKPLKHRKHKKMVQISAGIFQPMTFINRQRFKNYFMLNLYDAEISYQQQPLLRFVDFLTNQIILFILEPFSLHKYDTPNRGPYEFGVLNFTEKEIRKILYQSVYPCYTHLNINAFNLHVNFNSHPHDEAISLSIPRVNFASVPQLNPHRIHVRLDQLRRYEKKYPALAAMLQRDFQQKVSKSQWITRYLITAEGCQCGIIENQFNYEMYFQRSNNGDKDILLPFIKIEKDLLMQGRIKNMIIRAPRNIYNLVNKCFIFNLAFDDNKDIIFNANHEFQHLSSPSKLIYRLFLNQISILIPEIQQTVIVIQNCEYKFLKFQNARKEMQVNGKSMHILGQKDLMTPLNLDQANERGLEYAITMEPSGQKRMAATIRQIDFHYYHQVILPLFRYFLLDESCYPRQDIYNDIPLIVCEVYLLNSYIKVLQSADYVYALKGDIKVIWTRHQQPHPENYKVDKSFYPKDKEGSAYDIEFKGVTLRKYSKKAYRNLNSINIKEGNYYRSLSTSMVFSVNLTNIMRLQGETTYTDMMGTYGIGSLGLKLSYKDYEQIAAYFKKEPQQQAQALVHAEPAYVTQARHKATISRFSLQIGLSELPVPLLDVCLERSQINVELIGKTNVLTSKIEMSVNYWNMMIGRWEPLLERWAYELTLKAGPREKYLLTTSPSARPLLINFSVQSLKVLTLISKDLSEKGNLHVINKEERAKGIQISPYVITNRTGFSMIINSDFTLTAKLKNNEKIHLQNRTLELDENFSTISYQIEGDSTMYNLNLNMNQTHRPAITFNDKKYRLIVSPNATPVLKEIVISSPYVIHNKTVHPLILMLGQKEYRVEAEAKVPIPFTEEIHDNKPMRIDFPHLISVEENFNFQFRDIFRGYQHYIIYENSETFNCLISLESLNENIITISSLISFTNLLPLNLSLQVAVKKINGEKAVTHQEVQVNERKVFYEFGSKDQVQLRIHIRGFNYSEFVNLNLTNDREQRETNSNIIFIDCRGLQTAFRSKIIKKDKQKHIYIHADSVLINETDSYFYIFNDYQLLAGQRLKGIPQSHSKYVFLGKVEEPLICFSDQNPSEAKKFKTRQLGEQALSVINHTQLHELLISTSMNCLNEQAQIFTSIVRVAPRFIFVNKCTRPLVFQQHNTDQRFFLPVGDRKDWYWHHNEEIKKVTITAADSQFDNPDGWDHSAPFSLEAIQETVLVIRPRGRSEARLLLKTQVLTEQQQVFVSFKEVLDKEDSLIRIQNNLKLVNLLVTQQALVQTNPQWSQYRHFSCPSLKEVDFGWDFLQQQQRLQVTFQFIGPLRSKFNTDTVVIDLSHMHKPIITEFRGDNDQILTVETSMQIVGLRKTVIFQNKDESIASNYNDDELMQQMSGNRMGISLAEIGISIIGVRDEHRSQLAFVSIKKLDLIMTEKQQKRNFELRIKYMHIDNNLNHNTIYPVLFTPLKYKKTIDKQRPFFVCLIEQNLKTKQLREINYFRLCIEPISFKIYDEMITQLYNFSSALAILSEKQRALDVGLLFRSRDVDPQWRTRSIAKQGASTFLREVEIGKIIVELSFSMRPTFKGNIILHTMLSLFGSAVTNVSESQMRLNRFLGRNLSLGQAAGRLGGFYQREALKEMYKIAGSINLFGNPYVFVKYLAEGTWEIVNQPSEGFIKGPIQGAIGIGKGGVYFIRNVIAATFNSLQAVSESCSRGLAYITFDQKFITRRDKIQMQKSRHLLQGTKSALWALFTGFEVAISGVVRHPQEERRKSGALGVLKGIALGLTGLVTKPMSGIFEAVSKFSEGVKQTALFFQDGPNVNRSRPPRVFISSQDLEESKAINLLEFHSTKHLDKTVLLVALDQQIPDHIYTVVTSEYLVQLSKKNKKIIREVRLTDINEVESEEEAGKRGVRIRFNDQEILILTHKHRELFQCFKDIFSQIDQDFEDEEHYQQQ